MKALLLEEFNRDLILTEIPEPTLTSDGVIIKIKANGICRSDWHIWKGHWKNISTPLVMGHEFTGVIEEIGENVKKFKRGDRVIAPFTLSCGHCQYCLDGKGNICDERYAPGVTFNGGYGEYVHIPLADFNLAILPEEIDFVSGAALGCRFCTSFQGVVYQAKVAPGEWMVIHGCGGVGLSSLQFGVAIGANVICVDIDNEKLQLAKKLGAEYVINSKEENVVEAIKEITNGGADVSIDALGLSEIFNNSLNSLKKKGRHLQIGIPPDHERFEIAVRNLVNFEQKIIGSKGMPPQKFPYMLNMVKSKKINPGALVTKIITHEQVNKVLKDMDTFDNLGITVLEW